MQTYDDYAEAEKRAKDLSTQYGMCSRIETVDDGIEIKYVVNLYSGE